MLNFILYCIQHIYIAVIPFLAIIFLHYFQKIWEYSCYVKWKVSFTLCNYHWHYIMLEESEVKWTPDSLINICTHWKYHLTHWGRDKMADISQTTFPSVFSSMKMFEFRLKFHWSFVPKGPINKIPALVQIMAWRRPGDKLLSEPMLISLPTHICVNRPQWVKNIRFRN